MKNKIVVAALLVATIALIWASSAEGAIPDSPPESPLPTPSGTRGEMDLHLWQPYPRPIKPPQPAHCGE